MAVPLVRARVFAGDKVSLEGVYVPVFRRGRFDRLDERTSPFNLEPGVASCLAIGCPVPVFVPNEPARTAANAQGGARLNVTSGRVDWSVSAYRGFRPFGLYTVSLAAPKPQGGEGGPAIVRPLSIEFPRFTMIGGDFETVSGPWVVRGEVAAFVRDAFQSATGAAALEGQSFDAGAGLDRKAGEYRIGGQVVVHRETGGHARRTDVSMVVSADRSFSRQKYQGRLFGVYNPNSGSGFVRGIATATLRDNVALEGSLGWFAGSGLDTISRFAESDFSYVRLKYFF